MQRMWTQTIHPLVTYERDTLKLCSCICCEGKPLYHTGICPVSNQSHQRHKLCSDGGNVQKNWVRTFSLSHMKSRTLCREAGGRTGRGNHIFVRRLLKLSSCTCVLETSTTHPLGKTNSDISYVLENVQSNSLSYSSSAKFQENVRTLCPCASSCWELHQLQGALQISDLSRLPADIWYQLHAMHFRQYVINGLYTLFPGLTQSHNWAFSQSEVSH